MESLEEGSKSTKSFMKHVFNFDDDSKAEMMNIIQYSILAIVPIVLLNKGMQRFVPEADEEKGSLEILAEVVIQIIVMYIGLFFINRLVTFFPTYSGLKYPEMSIIFIILSSLMIVLSLQTKLGEKVSILYERVVELWEGKKEDKKNLKNNGNKNGNGIIKVSQPISQNQGIPPLPQQHTNTSFNDGTSIHQLPVQQQQQQQQQAINTQQQMPNYNAMFRNDQTQLGGFDEPMAANDALGGNSFFGSW
jgi:hypothetical protein